MFKYTNHFITYNFTKHVVFWFSVTKNANFVKIVFRNALFSGFKYKFMSL